MPALSCPPRLWPHPEREVRFSPPWAWPSASQPRRPAACRMERGRAPSRRSVHRGLDRLELKCVAFQLDGGASFLPHTLFPGLPPYRWPSDGRNSRDIWDGTGLLGHLSRTLVGQDGTTPRGVPECPSPKSVPSVPIGDGHRGQGSATSHTKSRPQECWAPTRRLSGAVLSARAHALRSASERSPSPP